MDNEGELLLTVWQERRAQARQAEDQRAIVTNMVLALSSLGLGLVAQRGLEATMLFVTVPLFLLGLYGATTAAKYYERFRFHITEASFVMERLNRMYPEAGVRDAAQGALDMHASRWRLLRRMRLNLVWIALHVAISMAGLSTSAAILIQVCRS